MSQNTIAESLARVNQTSQHQQAMYEAAERLSTIPPAASAAHCVPRLRSRARTPAVGRRAAPRPCRDRARRNGRCRRKRTPGQVARSMARRAGGQERGDPVKNNVTAINRARIIVLAQAAIPACEALIRGLAKEPASQCSHQSGHREPQAGSRKPPRSVPTAAARSCPAVPAVARFSAANNTRTARARGQGEHSAT